MSDLPLCVQCRQRPVEAEWRPFCSRRCRMVDLGRWLDGDYRIPVREDGYGPAAATPVHDPGDPEWP